MLIIKNVNQLEKSNRTLYINCYDGKKDTITAICDSSLNIPNIKSSIRVVDSKIAKDLKLKAFIPLNENMTEIGPFRLSCEKTVNPNKVNLVIHEDDFLYYYLSSNPEKRVYLGEKSALLLSANISLEDDRLVDRRVRFINESNPEKIYISGDYSKEWLKEISSKFEVVDCNLFKQLSFNF